MGVLKSEWFDPPRIRQTEYSVESFCLPRFSGGLELRMTKKDVFYLKYVSTITVTALHNREHSI